MVDGFIRNKFNTSYEPLRIHKTDNSLLWKHDFNKSDIKGTIVGCEVQLATSRFIYVLTLTRKVSNSRPRKLLNRNILCFDALTGDIRYNYPLVDIESQYLRTMKLFEKDGKLLILGNYSEEPLASSESEIKDLGYYSIAVDESGKELRKHLIIGLVYVKISILISLVWIKQNIKLESRIFFYLKMGQL